MYSNDKNISENKMLTEFLTRFYNISCSIEASNYTIDEFYDDFPEEMHDFLGKLAKNE